MTISADKFTPEVLLEAPRRSAPIPNRNGTRFLYTQSKYSFQSHSKVLEIRILDDKTGQSSILTNDPTARSPAWLDGDIAIWLQNGENGITNIMRADLAATTGMKPESIASLNGPLENLKTLLLEDGTFAIALTGFSTLSGELYNPEATEKPHSTGKVYTSLFVRHWDSYVPGYKSTIWYGLITKKRDKHILATPGLVNALHGKNGYNPLKLESPVPPFGSTGDFDISKAGLVFIAKDPNLDPASHTKTDLYYIPLKYFTEPVAPDPQIIFTGSFRGYCGSPAFSPDGRSLAFTRMKIDGYEADKPRLFLIPDINDIYNVQEFFESKDGNGFWDRCPGKIIWSSDGDKIYVVAEEHGRAKLFELPSKPSLATILPKAIISSGSINDVKVLRGDDSRLLVTSSSFIESSQYCIVDPIGNMGDTIISSSSKGGKAFGLSQDQVDELWYKGAGDYDVHAWIIKPSNFDKRKRYPLAYLIHGGPQGAWTESWSTRWNPAVFAEQGYVVITPNPTGSTGYGMAFQNNIQKEWGGRPYEDLVKGFEHIEEHLTYVDTSRAVCLGASYGGYMCNWIQGHSLGRKFKALVTHDGVFSTRNQYSSDELFFPHHDFGGAPWENKEIYKKWDPSRFVKHWATPHMIIHNELDYRLPISEGLAPFNVLQSMGIPSKFLTFPDENHWVLKPENSLVWHNEVFEWINKYSGAGEEQQIVDSMQKPSAC